VLECLNDWTGPDDLRSQAQRDHDALEEACRLLLTSRCLPEREGQPVQIQLNMTLSQLYGQAEAEPALSADLAARGAAAPPGAGCDAQIVPVVTGVIDTAFLAELAARFPGLAGLVPAAGSGDSGASHDDGDASGDGAADSIVPIADETLQRALLAAAGLTIADALRLLSGPGGLAALLRGQLAGPAGTVSLPLDVGAAPTRSPCRSAGRSPAETGAAGSPAATGPRSVATSATCGNAPTGARRPLRTAACSALSTIW
jgi:hypothetical protein